MASVPGSRPAPSTPRQGRAAVRWSSRQLLWLLGIVGVGFALRLAWVLYAAREPQGLIDPTFYSIQASGIADGDGYVFAFGGEPTAYYPVGYPAVLGAALWVVRHTPLPDDVPMTAAWLNLVLGVATLPLVAELGRRLLRDPRVGLVAAALLALWPNVVYHTAPALSETLFNFLVVSAVLVLVHRPWSAGRPGTGRLVVFGVLLALSSYVRPVSALLLGALAVVWMLAGCGWRRTLRDVGLVAVTVALLVLPWTIRNAVRLDSPVLISSNLGDNVCIGHHEGATGAFVLAEHCVGGYEHLPRPEYEVARNDENVGKAVRYAVSHPVDELRLLFWKGYFLFRADHDGLDAVESYGADQFISDRWRDVLESVADAWFFGVLALAVVAVPRLWRGDPWQRLLPLTMVALAIPPLLFFGDERFHVPLVPFMAVAAAVTIVYARSRPPREHDVTGTPQPEPVPAAHAGVP